VTGGFRTFWLLINIYHNTFIVIFISMHCVLFSTYNHLFGFFLFFLQNLIDTYVTVPIDVRITLLICLDTFPSASSFLTHLRPHVYYFYIQINIHISIHPSAPFIRTPCSLIFSLTCKFLRMCIYTSIGIALVSESSIFIHSYRHIHMYGLYSALYL